MARLAQGEVVAIDGKTVRRSHDRSRGQQAIHLVSAWASANSMTLGQVKVERKSNEITAIPKLLGLLALHGCIVTIDAMGCRSIDLRNSKRASWAIRFRPETTNTSRAVVEGQCSRTG